MISLLDRLARRRAGAPPVIPPGNGYRARVVLDRLAAEDELDPAPRAVVDLGTHSIVHVAEGYGRAVVWAQSHYGPCWPSRCLVELASPSVLAAHRSSSPERERATAGPAPRGPAAPLRFPYPERTQP